MTLRKAIWAVLTFATLGLSAPDAAQAGAGWRHHGYWHGGLWPGVVVGIGAGWPYPAGYYDYPFVIPYTYEGYGGCHVARQRVRTRAGWRVRLVDVCE